MVFLRFVLFHINGGPKTVSRYHQKSFIILKIKIVGEGESENVRQLGSSRFLAANVLLNTVVKN